MTLQSLIEAGISYVFHASPARVIKEVANGGVVLAGAYVPGATKKSGTRKDMRGGGAEFVYCRLVLTRSGSLIGRFGTRSSLADRVYYVMPIARLAEYNWFISSVDLNGNLPTGMEPGEVDQKDESRNGTIKGIVSTIRNGEKGTANYEVGVHKAIQISDLSHVLVSEETRKKYSTDLANLVQSAADMNAALLGANRGTGKEEIKMAESGPLKIQVARDGQPCWAAISGQ